MDGTRALLPLWYALITYLRGRTVRGLSAEPNVDAADRGIGELLRRAHAIPIPTYGYVLGDGFFQPRSTNAAHMTDAFERVLCRFHRQSGDDTLADQLETMGRVRWCWFECTRCQHATELVTAPGTKA